MGPSTRPFTFLLRMPVPLKFCHSNLNQTLLPLKKKLQWFKTLTRPLSCPFTRPLWVRENSGSWWNTVRRDLYQISCVWLKCVWQKIRFPSSCPRCSWGSCICIQKIGFTGISKQGKFLKIDSARNILLNGQGQVKLAGPSFLSHNSRS